MAKEYFNRLEFLKINKLVKKNPKLALKKFNVYIEEYPFDYSAYPYYINLLVTLRHVYKATIFLERVLLMVNHDTSYIYKAPDKYDIFLDNIIFAKTRILSYLKDYKALMDLFEKNKGYFAENGMLYIYPYCKRKLNLEDSPLDNTNYMSMQTSDYSETRFLEHIKKHMTVYSEDEKLNSNVFSLDFPFQRVLDEIKKIIPNGNGIYTGFFVDTYIFKFDNCGKVDSHLVDYFKVVCFHGTNNFITMLPVYGYDNYVQHDLNYMNEFNNIKLKNESMVSKYYKRYQK